MNAPFDAKVAAEELTANLKEVLNPPPGGASLGAILGAYILKAVLRDAGYAIVPISPTTEMHGAFRSGLFKPFYKRYAAMLTASWPETPSPPSAPNGRR